MSRTDSEIDQDWKPNGRRPQSTIAQAFQQELMDIFRIDNSVADLDEKVDKRKKEINSASSELEALEARIREMEERLKQQAPALGAGQPPEKDQDQNQKYVAGSRPYAGTARQGQQAVPGALPPTPVESEGEYHRNHHYHHHPSHHNLAFRHHPSSRPPPPFQGSSPVILASPSSQFAAPGRDNTDSRSIKSISSNLTAADYVIVSSRASDGDREQDA
ncbi:hypothetical protein QBC44DRAFT_60801 [Cladorrhinum sp. PSN332]|nr:hypothetical protein QBC44DRAFT_60801 [Cladorrhinum sp. PSN332]